MEKIVKRKSSEAVLESDLRIVSDYKSGFTIKQIMDRNKIKSHVTIYNAIDRINAMIADEQDE